MQVGSAYGLRLSLVTMVATAAFAIVASGGAGCGGKMTDLITDAGDSGLPPDDVGMPQPDVAAMPDTSNVVDGCGGCLDTAPPPKDSGGDVYPAPHPPAPTVVSMGGSTLASPTLIPVFFSGDADQASLSTMLQDLGSSSYWQATTSEYGVGAATMGPSIVLTDAPPSSTTDDDIQAMLQANLGPGAWGSPVPGAIYVLYYPATTSITFEGVLSCKAFGGYHNSTTNGSGQTIVYAVIPRCDGLNGLMGLDEVTVATSHELIEAATDPTPLVLPAYVQPDNDHLAWALVTGGEVADMCVLEPGAYTLTAGLAYRVQRTWSNAAAKASADPCVPAPATETVYFNSPPVLTDNVNLTFQGSPVETKGVQIPVGSKKTVELDLFSNGPTGGPWTVQALDIASALNGQPPALDFAFDTTTGQNGDKLHLTITVLHQDPTYGGELFVIVSAMNMTNTLWVGAVGN